MNSIIPIPEIQQRIHVIRGKRAITDADLAKFYGVTTFNLNKAVSRNLDRFPEDFTFQLSREEARNLIFQFGISSSQHGGRRKVIRVFTEQGVAMLAGVLRGQRAAAMSIAIVRAFVQPAYPECPLNRGNLTHVRMNCGAIVDSTRNWYGIVNRETVLKLPAEAD